MPSKRIRRIPEKITTSPKVEEEKKKEDINQTDIQPQKDSLPSEDKTE